MKKLFKWVARMFQMREYEVIRRGGFTNAKINARSAVVLEDRTLVFYGPFLNQIAVFRSTEWTCFIELDCRAKK